MASLTAILRSLSLLRVGCERVSVPADSGLGGKGAQRSVCRGKTQFMRLDGWQPQDCEFDAQAGLGDATHNGGRCI
ncbi:hypothetical protein K523DRAFT_321652 [Schizophyllum commune Tattone D]|nr:hypothetical protein K523DRAFT_321652 [Schizophyllum commune Tattone D]